MEESERRQNTLFFDYIFVYVYVAEELICYLLLDRPRLCSHNKTRPYYPPPTLPPSFPPAFCHSLRHERSQHRNSFCASVSDEMDHKEMPTPCRAPTRSQERSNLQKYTHTTATLGLVPASPKSPDRARCCLISSLAATHVPRQQARNDNDPTPPPTNPETLIVFFKL